ncbi:MAG: hypothetical protein AAF614_42090 [Chloroflexota bacterium]
MPCRNGRFAGETAVAAIKSPSPDTIPNSNFPAPLETAVSQSNYS